QRRLAGAVRTHDGHACVARDTKWTGTHDGIAVADRERGRLEDGLAAEIGSLEAPAVTGRLRRRLDALDARKLLPAAARLFRALPGAVSSDELLGLRDLFGLPRVRAHLRGLSLETLARIVRVAAA